MRVSCIFNPNVFLKDLINPVCFERENWFSVGMVANVNIAFCIRLHVAVFSDFTSFASSFLCLKSATGSTLNAVLQVSRKPSFVRIK